MGSDSRRQTWSNPVRGRLINQQSIFRLRQETLTCSIFFRDHRVRALKASWVLIALHLSILSRSSLEQTCSCIQCPYCLHEAECDVCRGMHQLLRAILSLRRMGTSGLALTLTAPDIATSNGFHLVWTWLLLFPHRLPTSKELTQTGWSSCIQAFNPDPCQV